MVKSAFGLLLLTLVRIAGHGGDLLACSWKTTEGQTSTFLLSTCFPLNSAFCIKIWGCSILLPQHKVIHSVMAQGCRCFSQQSLASFLIHTWVFLSDSFLRGPRASLPHAAVEWTLCASGLVLESHRQTEVEESPVAGHYTEVAMKAILFPKLYKASYIYLPNIEILGDK